MSSSYRGYNYKENDLKGKSCPSIWREIRVTEGLSYWELTVFNLHLMPLRGKEKVNNALTSICTQSSAFVIESKVYDFYVS